MEYESVLNFAKDINLKIDDIKLPDGNIYFGDSEAKINLDDFFGDKKAEDNKKEKTMVSKKTLRQKV